MDKSKLWIALLTCLGAAAAWLLWTRTPGRNRKGHPWVERFNLP